MRIARDTRLLIAAIAISALVLLLLAQFRFPEQQAAAVPVPTTPLERLAARATYDDLAAIVGRLEGTIAPSLVVLRLASPADSEPKQLSDLLSPTERTQDGVRYVPALRISATTALAAIGGATRISGIVGQTDASATAGLIATDPIRRLALVRVPDGPATTVPLRTLAELKTPVYVVAVEGTQAGVTLRPLFLGRGDRFEDARWDRPLLALSGAMLTTPGALIFSLEGQFVGSVVANGETVSIAGARDVMDSVNRLAAGQSIPLGDAGIAAQPLTPALAAATKTPTGVLISDVRENGPAAAVLDVGDVIIEFNGQPAESPDRLLSQIARSAPGTQLPITFSRAGQIRQATLTLAAASSASPSIQTADLDLQFLRGTGSLLRTVAPATAATTWGLVEGDVIVRIGNMRAPTPAVVRRLIRQLRPGDFLLVTVLRDRRQWVIPVQAPAPPNAATATP